ncbi:MAG: hypothetical protein HN862_17895 [Candidatus Scalindua sp.]|nr:hypothetical protein [Candidatus Scalindua sp.]MBT6048322.1 hypothetical protein [Candidatus Scalindua sp.]MBT7213269.1 hypothetical protein [Candidatus Scalindua sp.]MBT7592521.1 hypothetical protein [Candidatus Scalindua sp.]
MENNLDKRNFINWYCWYATSEEIKKAEQTNKAAINRLVNEHSYEVEKINTAKRYYDNSSLPEGVLPEFHSFGCV